MTPRASVAILEKLALLKIAFCRASAPSACSLTRIFSGLSGIVEAPGIMFSVPGDCGRVTKIGDVENLGLVITGRFRAYERLFGRRDQITWDGAHSAIPYGRARKITTPAAHQQRDSAVALRAMQNLQCVNRFDGAPRN